MIIKILKQGLAFLFLITSVVIAQDFSMLDPNPYDPETEPNIDMFISSWKESMPRHTHGSLVERDIFTKCKGDPLKPASRGAVLTDVKRFSYATLDAYASTTPTILKDEQEIFYIDSGKGVIKSGNKTAELHKGIGVIMPPEVEFTLINTGKVPLTMYIVVEPIPDDFKPNKEMIVKDLNVVPLRTTAAHWCYITRGRFSEKDGLAILAGIGPVWLDPMTIGQPHSHREGIEEIWVALKGDINFLLGKNMRKMPVGTAYKIPPDGKTPHSNINVSDKPIMFYEFMKNVPGKTESYSELDPKPYNPATEPDPDMFISSWKESMPRHTHGSLVERDIFTLCKSDPVKPATKGAVLKGVSRLTYGTLEAHASTTPVKLENEQEIFYIESGKGVIKTGNKTAELYEGIGVLMPPDIEFTMTNTGDKPLTMYIMGDPVPEGFKPKKEMVVKDENTTPISTSTVHWCHIFTRLFIKDDGLATIGGMGPVLYDPLTMGQPHSHDETTEELWIALKGDIHVLLGKQIRKLPPGSAYKIPPNSITPHSNINTTEEQIKLFYIGLAVPKYE